MREGLKMAEAVEAIVALDPTPPLDPRGGGRGGGKAEAAGAGGPLLLSPASSLTPAEAYCEAIRPLQVDNVPGLASLGHTYATQAAGESVHPRSRIARLARELSSLPQMLPTDQGSSIFVRADEENCTLW